MPLAYGSSILVGTGIPGPTDSVSPCGVCGQLYVGPTGYILDDRQRLAQSFSFQSPVHVDTIAVGISGSYWTNSQVDVLITDGILNLATGPVNVLASQSLYPMFSFRPQTVEFGTSLDLMPSVMYYIVLNGRSANAETNPGQSPVTQGPGFLKDSYYANSGLGLNPIQANWTPLTLSTVSFELIGTTVPEPELGLLVGILLLTQLRNVRGTGKARSLSPK